MSNTKKSLQSKVSIQSAIQFLREGNARFVNECTEKQDLMQRVKNTALGQHPFAVVVSCMDSRVPVEIVFDQSIGDIFSVRVAGNLVNEDILGSLEYGCKVVESKLIMILGHTDCGAIKAACDYVEMGNVTHLTTKLKKAVHAVKTESSVDRSSKNAHFVNKVSEQNVRITMKEIMSRSTILKELLEKKEIAIVGGLYNVATGQVAFLEEADESDLD